MTKIRVLLFMLVIVLIPSAIWALAGMQSSLPWEPITAERLLKPRPGDWLNYRRTVDVNGFSPLTQINKSNVGSLRSVWSYPVRDESRWVPTPIVANGLMYVSEGLGRVLAFDVATGEIRWIHKRTYPEDVRLSMAYPRARGYAMDKRTSSGYVRL